MKKITVNFTDEEYAALEAAAAEDMRPIANYIRRAVTAQLAVLGDIRLHYGPAQGTTA